MKRIISLGIFLFCAGFVYAQKPQEYLEQGKTDKALKYCSKLNGEGKYNCFLQLAEHFFDAGEYPGAAECYVSAGRSESGYSRIATHFLEEKQYATAWEYLSHTKQPVNGLLRIADNALINNEPDTAALYYARAGYPAYGNSRIARYCLESGHTGEAASYFERSGDPAYGNFLLAASFMKKGEKDKAQEYFTKAGKSAEGFLYMALADSLHKEEYLRNAADSLSKEEISQGLVTVSLLADSREILLTGNFSEVHTVMPYAAGMMLSLYDANIRRGYLDFFYRMEGEWTEEPVLVISYASEHSETLYSQYEYYRLGVSRKSAGNQIQMILLSPPQAMKGFTRAYVYFMRREDIEKFPSRRQALSNVLVLNLNL